MGATTSTAGGALHVCWDIDNLPHFDPAVIDRLWGDRPGLRIAAGDTLTRARAAATATAAGYTVEHRVGRDRADIALIAAAVAAAAGTVVFVSADKIFDAAAAELRGQGRHVLRVRPPSAPTTTEGAIVSLLRRIGAHREPVSLTTVGDAMPPALRRDARIRPGRRPLHQILSSCKKVAVSDDHQFVQLVA